MFITMSLVLYWCKKEDRQHRHPNWDDFAQYIGELTVKELIYLYVLLV